MNPLPPQAYTRETMVKAYQWVQSQNAHIRELATTPDLLVSLYLKAQMQGNECLDRPSIQNFKSELKSLAGMIGEFETAPAAEAMTEASLAKMSSPPQGTVQMPPQPPHHYAPAAGAYAHNRPPHQSQVTSHAPPPPHLQRPHAPSQAQNQSAQKMAPLPPPTASSTQPAPNTGAAQFELDPRSLQMIQEVKVQLNVTSDMEALRILISVGYTKFKRFSEHS